MTFWKKWGISDAEWNGLTPGVKKGFKAMHKELQSGKFKEEANLNAGDQVLSTTADRASVLLKQFQEAQKALRDLAGQGYGLTEDAPIIGGLNRAISLTDTFLNNAKYGAEAMDRLANSTPTNQFQNLSKVLGDSTGELAANAATLNQLGLSYREYSKNLDMMIYSFSQNETSVKSFNQQLFKFAKEVKQLPSVVSNNFQLVAQSLGYAFPQIQEQFVKIQKLSAQTGVSVQKLMGTFGQQTDTIAGASSFAASMNSLLGKNVFSATQVLMMDEAERMTETRKALRESQVYKDYMSDDPKLKKFALRAMSSRLQMSPDETRRFLDEGRADATGPSLKSQMAKNVGEDFTQHAGLLTKSISSLTKAITENADLIDYRRRTATNRDLAQMRRGNLLSMLDPKGDGGGLRTSLKNEMRAEFVKQFGAIKGFDGPSSQVVADLIFDSAFSNEELGPSVAQKLNEAYKMVAAEPLLDEPFKNMGIVNKLKKGDFAAANTALNNFLQRARETSMIPKQDDRISRVEADTLAQFKNKPQQLRRLMRKFRIDENDASAEKVQRLMKEVNQATGDDKREAQERLDEELGANISMPGTRVAGLSDVGNFGVLNVYTTDGEAIFENVAIKVAARMRS